MPLPLAVAGVGKAAARMAAGCESALGAENVRGAVLTADGCGATLGSVECAFGGHPVPDARGFEATARLAAFVGEAPGAVLFLLSGGASSLLVQPRPPVTLADKIAVSRLLLASGAPIAAFNTVRKHLSLVKGGGLLRRARGKVFTLALSDVVGDDPQVIGSGPTVADPTTYADARAIMVRFDVLARAPASVRQVIEAGCRGDLPETVKPGDPEASRSALRVIGSNRLALDGAAAEAEAEGLEVRRLAEPIEGDGAAAALAFAELLRREAAEALASGRVRCLLAGGETTVVVRGPGRGGRNQEFALALAERIAGLPVSLLSAGSDGVDGPTDAAGAFIDGATLSRAAALGLTPADHLAANDSYGFFARLDDLFQPGATGTNVMDLVFALVGGPVL